MTVCSWNKECLFGDIIDEKMHLSEDGKIVSEEWQRSSAIRQEIELDEFVIMPNHLHAIVVLNNTANIKVGANGRSPLQMKPRSISSLIAGFKSIVTKRINTLRNTPGIPVWQRNYYEHIIRNENELNEIREYINNNPLKWELDNENPKKSK